jgi:hypothetical protein
MNDPKLTDEFGRYCLYILPFRLGQSFQRPLTLSRNSVIYPLVLQWMAKTSAEPRTNTSAEMSRSPVRTHPIMSCHTTTTNTVFTLAVFTVPGRFGSVSPCSVNADWTEPCWAGPLNLPCWHGWLCSVRRVASSSPRGLDCTSPCHRTWNFHCNINYPKYLLQWLIITQNTFQLHAARMLFWKLSDPVIQVYWKLVVDVHQS